MCKTIEKILDEITNAVSDDRKVLSIHLSEETFSKIWKEHTETYMPAGMIVYGTGEVRLAGVKIKNSGRGGIDSINIEMKL